MVHQWQWCEYQFLKEFVFTVKQNQAGRGKQTKEFLSHADGPTSGWVLGLKLYMHKDYFQLPELRLKCVATYHDIIKEYQTHLNIYSRSYNAIEAQSTVSGSFPTSRLLFGSSKSIYSLISATFTIILPTIFVMFFSYNICPSPIFSSFLFCESRGELLLFARFRSNDGLSSNHSFHHQPVIFSLSSPLIFHRCTLLFLPPFNLLHSRTTITIFCWYTRKKPRLNEWKY